MSDKYFVLHTDASSILFAHQLRNAENSDQTLKHVDLIHIDKDIFIHEILESYNHSSSRIWNAYMLDGYRMYFSIENKNASLLDVTEYIIENTCCMKRQIVAALCTQSVFAYIYEKLQTQLSSSYGIRNLFICEIGDHSKNCAMHANLRITPYLISVTMRKRLRIMELMNNSRPVTLDILNISVDIQLKNFKKDRDHNTPPIPTDVCIKIEYEEF